MIVYDDLIRLDSDLRQVPRNIAAGVNSSAVEARRNQRVRLLEEVARVRSERSRVSAIATRKSRCFLANGRDRFLEKQPRLTETLSGVLRREDDGLVVREIRYRAKIDDFKDGRNNGDYLAF